MLGLLKSPFTNIFAFALNLCDGRVTSIDNPVNRHHTLLHFYLIVGLQYGSVLLVPYGLKYAGIYGAQYTAGLTVEGDKVQDSITKVEKILRIYRVDPDEVIMRCPHPQVKQI